MSVFCSIALADVSKVTLSNIFLLASGIYAKGIVHSWTSDCRCQPGKPLNKLFPVCYLHFKQAPARTARGILRTNAHNGDWSALRQLCPRT
jgi:hypothetical protein